jgi:DNA-binding PadR family transcriptional regulator
MLSSTELTPFSYCVLALVGQKGAGPHEMTRMMRQGRLYWTAAGSQWYAEPKRLEKLGYLRSRKEPGRTRERTHYMLTARGRKALREWIAAPSSLPRIQHEALVRVLSCDLGEERDLLGSLDALRVDIDDERARLREAEEIAATLPHRERYLRLVHRFGHLLLDAHEEWLDEIERELA